MALVGFSRGAALALVFANRVYKQVIDPRTGKPPVIRFVGLWDVVGSFGIPINLGPFLFTDVKWPKDFVKNSARTIATDDRVHHMVAKGTHPDCNEPHATCITETAADELTPTRASTFKP